jgi:hypothetical protein
MERCPAAAEPRVACGCCRLLLLLLLPRPPLSAVACRANDESCSMAVSSLQSPARCTLQGSQHHASIKRALGRPRGPGALVVGSSRPSWWTTRGRRGGLGLCALLFGPVVLPVLSAQLTRAFTVQCTRCARLAARSTRNAARCVVEACTRNRAVTCTKARSPAPLSAVLRRREKASPHGWELDSPDPQPVAPAADSKSLAAAARLGRRRRFGIAATPARPRLNVCPATDPPLLHIMTPSTSPRSCTAPPNGAAEPTIASQKRNLDARVVRNGLSGQSSSRVGALCVLAAVPRARLVRTALLRFGRRRFYLPNYAIVETCPQRGRPRTETCLLPDTSLSRRRLRLRLRLASLVRRVRAARKNRNHMQPCVAPGLSHATSVDSSSQKTSPASPRRSPGPVALAAA